MTLDPNLKRVMVTGKGYEAIRKQIIHPVNFTGWMSFFFDCHILMWWTELHFCFIDFL
jgi:hypothetical protein